MKEIKIEKEKADCSSFQPSYLSLFLFWESSKWERHGIKVKISIYTRSGEDSPSAYYRILQYSSLFSDKVKHNYAVSTPIYKKHNADPENLLYEILFYISMYFRNTSSLIMDIITPPDVLIVQRAIFARITPIGTELLVKQALKRAKNIYWDFDDNIFEAHEVTLKEKKLLCKYSTNIIVTNEFLKSRLPDDCKVKTIILPTTDGDMKEFDIVREIHNREKTYAEEIRILWIAMHPNLKYIERIAPELDKAARIIKQKTGKTLKLISICDAPINYKPECIVIENIQWTRESVKGELSNAHVGVMPLLDSEFNRGKGSFKMIQYMAVGLSVVASAVGMNKDVMKNCDIGYCLHDSENLSLWVEAILRLSTDIEFWKKCSINSKKEWDKNYSFHTNLAKWKKLIASATSKKEEES